MAVKVTQKICSCCGRVLPAKSYSPTKSPFFIDGLLSICNDCLDAEVKRMGGEWAYMDLVCQWADMPWVPEQFTKIYTSVPNQAASTYMKYFSQDEYNRIHWETYQERWQKAIEENNEKILHPIFNQQEIQQLKLDWGEDYTPQQYYALEDLYKGLIASFGVSTKLGEREARLLSKLSLQMDQCVAEGGAGIDKLVSAYNNIKKSAGFEASNAQDQNEFSSISELVKYMEKIGWKKKFHNDENKDIVDNTMKNIQNYARRLYQNEASMQDQIETTIEAKKRMDALEMQNFEDLVDEYDNAGYSVAPEDEEKEDFDPNL